MNLEYPVVEESAPFFTVLDTMTKGRLGMTTVLNQGLIRGVISDGDIRRAVGKAQAEKGNPLDLVAADMMTGKPVTISAELPAIEAAGIMESRKITFLVVEERGHPKGILHIHDLLAAKVI